MMTMTRTRKGNLQHPHRRHQMQAARIIHVLVTFSRCPRIPVDLQNAKVSSAVSQRQSAQSILVTLEQSKSVPRDVMQCLVRMISVASPKHLAQTTSVVEGWCSPQVKLVVPRHARTTSVAKRRQHAKLTVARTTC